MQGKTEDSGAMFRRFSVSERALEQGRLLGMDRAEIAAKARRAARYRDPVATHRFHQLAFLVRDGEVLGVWDLDDLPFSDPDVLVTGDCPVCETEGCEACQYTGKLALTEEGWARLRAELVD